MAEIDGVRLPTLFPGEIVSSVKTAGLSPEDAERIKEAILASPDSMADAVATANKLIEAFAAIDAAARSALPAGEASNEDGAAIGDSDAHEVLLVVPADESVSVRSSDEDRTLAAIEADLTLVVSRGLVTIDRYKGISEDALRDGAKDVLGSLAFALLGCSELLRRIPKLRIELAKSR